MTLERYDRDTKLTQYKVKGRGGKGSDNARQVAERQYRKQKCAELTNDLNRQIEEEALHLGHMVRWDERFDQKCATVAKFSAAIVLAGLKSVPFVGGYAGLLQKIIRDPLNGTYEVLRSGHGDAKGTVFSGGGFSLFGDHSNGVSSALTVDGAKGYNLSTGNPTLFQDDDRMKLERMELEWVSCASKELKGKFDALTNKSKYRMNKDIVKKLAFEVDQHEEKVIHKLRFIYINEVNAAKLKVLAGISIADISQKDGIRDLESGLFTDKQGELISLADINKLGVNASSYMTKNSRMWKTLHNLRTNINNFQDQNYSKLLKGTSITSGETFELLNSITRSRVHLTKAKYVAYKDELIGSNSIVFDNRVDLHVKGLIDSLPYKSIKKYDNKKRANKLAVALSLIHELISAYFGSTRICSLPPTLNMLKVVSYCLSDCAASAAYFMTDERKVEAGSKLINWRDWFWAYLSNMPETKVFRENCRENELFRQFQTTDFPEYVIGLVMFNKLDLSVLPNSEQSYHQLRSKKLETINMSREFNHRFDKVIKTTKKNLPALGGHTSKTKEEKATAARLFLGLTPEQKEQKYASKADFYDDSVFLPWLDYKATYDIMQNKRELSNDLLQYHKKTHEVLKLLLIKSGLRKDIVSSN
ncbi:hypothetical protein [uncultured Shewanella sp.]|uniref:hypothetical protein n=1 Tax=uncultured Shewanella sp. TaxID=173975 RepID=UPI00261A95F9|nr:hypothetical protein [uncultured Shewanella sp.]